MFHLWMNSITYFFSGFAFVLRGVMVASFIFGIEILVCTNKIIIDFKKNTPHVIILEYCNQRSVLATII